jgi:pimeloyl-ACP methyl ester carboxylesterase
MTYQHVTAPTQFVEANGIRFAHRRFGQEGGTPLLFMQHFRGGMDHWDPAVTDGFAENRPVILFDNAGVASSSGETPDTIDAMAEHAADFVAALGLSRIDLLGFSIGGYIAQTLTIRHPELIRRLILVGTGPRAGVFHRSIMENIRYGRPTATDDEVLRAAIAARCDFVETLPQGLTTMVGDRGVKFSGGQRQRIAIARAFLKDAPILLLDEATAALDSESEEAIREALACLMRGRTVIAIAHRLATLRSFDRVIMLQGGRIIEDGPPDRLMRGGGPYRELVAREMSRLAAHAA